MKTRDPLTVDLFDVPVERAPKPGALDGMQFRHMLSEQVKASPLSRHQIAARMSELVGHEITKHQLDSWTAESREGWRFPLEYLPALEVALADICERFRVDITAIKTLAQCLDTEAAQQPLPKAAADAGLVAQYSEGLAAVFES
jgi:hypothetical protein